MIAEHRPTHRIRRGALAILIATTIPVVSTAIPANADPTNNAWGALRNCESGGNYSVVAVNGHYGAYQFDLATWRSVGGTGQPNKASPAEQNYRALYLYRMRGWEPWACGRSLHLAGDRDASSHRIPTRAQAAYMGGGPTTTTATTHPTAMPPWPGVVYAYGNCATALRTWQLRMNSDGFHFTGTGCYYNDTKAAVLALQRANHIKASGRLGPLTWKAAWQGKKPTTNTLHDAAVPTWPGVVYAYGDCATALRTWQLRMNAYGYHFDGTGCYYAKTKTAVLALQHANHINPSGRLGPETWQAAWLGTKP
jgi:hypothetical protein